MLGKYQDKESRSTDTELADSDYESRYGNPLIYGKVYSFLPEFEGINFERNVFAELSLFGGIFAIVTALLGLCTVYQRKFFFTCPFAAMSGTIGLILIIAGALSI